MDGSAFRHAQVALPQCSAHPGSALSHMCMTCDNEHVCQNCVQQKHEGHDVLGIKQYREKKKTELQEAIDNSKQKMKKWKKSIRLFQEAQEDNEALSIMVESAIKDRGKELKEIIDVIVQNFLLQNTANADTNNIKLERQIQLYKEVLKNEEVLITRSENSLLTGSTDEFVALRTELAETDIDNSLPYINNINLNVIPYIWDDVERIFGSLDHVSVTSSRRVYNRKEYRKSFEVPNKEGLLEMASIHTESYPKCICPISNGAIWVSISDQKGLSLITRTGSVKKSITLDAVVTDICCTKTEDHLMIGCVDNSVRRISTDGKTVHRFRTSSTPLCLCLSRGGNVLVGFWDRIEEFCQEGKYINTVSTDISGIRLFSEPSVISISPFDGTIAIASNSGLVVLDNEYRLIFRHFGSYVLSGTGKHKKKVETDFEFTMPLRPVGVCYDKNGRLVIADFRNSCLFRACARSGEIESLFTTRRPSALAIQSDGMLWVGFRQTLNLYNYSE